MATIIDTHLMFGHFNIECSECGRTIYQCEHFDRVRLDDKQDIKTLGVKCDDCRNRNEKTPKPQTLYYPYDCYD